MARVVVTDFVADTMQPERDVLDGIAEIVPANAHSEQDLIGIIEQADALMVYHNISLTQASIRRLTNCKLIVRCGVGFDNVDHHFAAQRGIPVANVPDYGTEEVADSAIAMTLALARGVHPLNSRLQSGSGEWCYTQAAPLQRLRGLDFGIVGLGRIGIATARRAAALGMEVWFYDPYREDGYDKALGIHRADSLEDLMVRSHVVSIHCPLTDETRHMVNAETLSNMRPGGFLVNTARGAVVRTADIPALIERNQLAGVGIDVLEIEPPGDTDPLVSAWRDPGHPCYHRVILNPHAAFYSEQGLTDMRWKGAVACRKAILGQAIPNIVNQVGG